MATTRRTVPTYHLTRIDSDGVRWYDLRCIFCGRVDTRGLPNGTSVGFYFSYPLRCPHCARSAKYYCGGSLPPQAGQTEGSGPATVAS